MPQLARAPVPGPLPGETNVPTGPQGKVDYSWLAQDLMSRIEQTIRYPTEARLNQWQGKVVVKVIVRADGEIESLKIVQTSGHPVLDEEALALLRRISPLKLNQPLGKDRIPVQVPIRYFLK
jgi:protein TonB